MGLFTSLEKKKWKSSPCRLFLLAKPGYPGRSPFRLALFDHLPFYIAVLFLSHLVRRLYFYPSYCFTSHFLPAQNMGRIYAWRNCANIHKRHYQGYHRSIIILIIIEYSKPQPLHLLSRGDVLFLVKISVFFSEVSFGGQWPQPRSFLMHLTFCF